MSLKEYSNILQEVLTACKRQYINANIKKLQNDIIAGVCVIDIIENLHKYI